MPIAKATSKALPGRKEDYLYLEALSFQTLQNDMRKKLTFGDSCKVNVLNDHVAINTQLFWVTRVIGLRDCVQVIHHMGEIGVQPRRKGPSISDNAFKQTNTTT